MLRPTKIKDVSRSINRTNVDPRRIFDHGCASSDHTLSYPDHLRVSNPDTFGLFDSQDNDSNYNAIDETIYENASSSFSFSASNNHIHTDVDGNLPTRDPNGNLKCEKEKKHRSVDKFHDFVERHYDAAYGRVAVEHDQTSECRWNENLNALEQHNYHHHSFHYYYHENKFNLNEDQTALIRKMSHVEQAFKDGLAIGSRMYRRPYKRLLPRHAHKKLFQNIEEIERFSEDFIKNVNNFLQSESTNFDEIIDIISAMVQTSAEAYNKYKSGYKNAKKTLKQLFNLKTEGISDSSYSVITNDRRNKLIIKIYITFPVMFRYNFKDILRELQKTVHKNSDVFHRLEDIIKITKMKKNGNLRRLTLCMF